LAKNPPRGKGREAGGTGWRRRRRENQPMNVLREGGAGAAKCVCGYPPIAMKNACQDDLRGPSANDNFNRF
jgi:hypothetical protein